MYEKFKNEKEFKVIAELIPKNTRVLDVGCGDGSLMNLLQTEKNIEVRGIRAKSRKCSSMYSQRFTSYSRKC